MAKTVKKSVKMDASPWMNYDPEKKTTEIYKRMMERAEVVSVSPIEEVLTAEEIETIEQYRAARECHYNAFWSALELDDVEYCEGYAESTPHAICFHKPSGKYFDPTVSEKSYDFTLMLRIDPERITPIFKKRRANFLLFEHLYDLTKEEMEVLL